jgi:hypothetical protein
MDGSTAVLLIYFTFSDLAEHSPTDFPHSTALTLDERKGEKGSIVEQWEVKRVEVDGSVEVLFLRRVQKYIFSFPSSFSHCSFKSPDER